MHAVQLNLGWKGRGSVLGIRCSIWGLVWGLVVWGLVWGLVGLGVGLTQILVNESGFRLVTSLLLLYPWSANARTFN